MTNRSQEVGVEIAPYAHRAAPSSRQLVGVWLRIGIQSFGGGSATHSLVYDAFVERHTWIAPEEYARCLAISSMTPGLTLLALTVLLGRRVAGRAGVVLSLIGLLVPTISVTMLMTALYSSIQEQGWVRAALRGLIPALAALNLWMVGRLMHPLFSESRREGRASLVLSALLMIGSGLLVTIAQAPVVVLLVLGGLIGAAAAWYSSSRPATQE